MKYQRLERDALFIVSDPRDAWCLPKGTIVVPMQQNPPSPLTERSNEIYVTAPNAIGQEWRGWLAASTPLKNASVPGSHPPWDRGSTPLLWEQDRLMELTPIDVLRETVLRARIPNQADDEGTTYTLHRWLCRYGTDERPLLTAVLQQMKSAVIEKDAEWFRIAAVLQIMLGETFTKKHIEEVARTERQREAHLAAVRVNQRRHRMSKSTKKVRAPRQTGTALAAKLAETTVLMAVATLAVIVKKLQAGKDTSSAELQKLRDGINKLADVAREKKQGQVVEQLSTLNRQVRRLERSRRK